MFPCYFKSLSGFDCPGCGFQRSVLALINGDFFKSVELYPAVLPILLLIIMSLLQRFVPAKWWKPARLTMLYVCISVISVSYLLKLIN